MVTETLAPDETKTFKSWDAILTPINVSIDGGGTEGSVQIDLSTGLGDVEDHNLTDVAPLALKKMIFGAIFTIKNTGTSTLSVETSSLHGA